MLDRLIGFAVTAAALGTVMAVVDALLPEGTVRDAALAAAGLGYLATLAAAGMRLFAGGG